MDRWQYLHLQVAIDPTDHSWHVGVLEKEGRSVRLIRAFDPGRLVGPADVLAFLNEVARCWLWAKAMDEEPELRHVVYVAADRLH